jgi:hypothetical protein
MLVRQPKAISCLLSNGTTVLLPFVFRDRLTIGDEITFAIPTGEAVRSEVLVTTRPSSGIGKCVYLAPIEYATQPKSDKRNQSFVSAQVRNGNLGISSVFLPCDAVREYFYGAGNSQSGSNGATLYQTIRIGPNASPAEIRVAFKLRSLELNTIGAARPEHVKLERAFNILAHPELRAHYERLLADPELPAIFPYGGVGSILVAGDRSRGETFFTRRILAFVPERTHRRFRLPVRNCEFYADRALCRDVRRKLQFWLDPALLHASWEPSWNRWKRLCLEHKAIERKDLERISSELG